MKIIKKENPKDERIMMRMDKKLRLQLQKYSNHNNQSLAKTARQALNQFLKETK